MCSIHVPIDFLTPNANTYQAGYVAAGYIALVSLTTQAVINNNIPSLPLVPLPLDFPRVLGRALLLVAMVRALMALALLPLARAFVAAPASKLDAAMASRRHVGVRGGVRASALSAGPPCV